MNERIKIVVANDSHHLAIVHFLEQIQVYMDEITKDDEDYLVFVNVLTELIEKSNNEVIFSFLGGDYADKWINQLPMTVYYAVVGYMHLIDVDLMDLIDTTEKLNNLVNETFDKLDNVHFFEKTYHKIYLN